MSGRYQEYFKDGKCQSCGREFLKGSPNQKFCFDCKAEAFGQAEVKDKHFCPRKKQCVYGRPLYETGQWFCDYIGIMGHRRPCPVQGCTEFSPRRKKKK